MASVSPLLQNKLNYQSSNRNQTITNHNERIYQDLQKKANEVKPNEAKAVLVNQGMLGDPIAATKDVIKDGANFFKAVKTGKMGDSNLGRINDLGLKIGAGIIATYLAAHSKTKTESIMRFIGGATFISMMSLWPKLFINIPARLVHGFRIDEKYISAQGDKKDLYLDNQFIPTKLHSKKQMLDEMQRMGIDPNDKNAEEKWHRKRQKTALQNRALWMASAGGATPLLTSMVGNFVEPYVEKAVVKADVKNTQKQLKDGLAIRLATTKPEIRNVEELDGFFRALSNGAMDNDAFEKLANILNPYIFLAEFKDVDDKTPILNVECFGLNEELQKAYESLTKCDSADLKKQLAGVKKITTKGLGVLKTPADLAKALNNKFDEADIDAIIKELGNDTSIANVRKVLQNKGVAPESIKEVVKSVARDNSHFETFVKGLNKTSIAQVRARTKEYLKLMNPINGSKAESATTLEFTKTMKKLFKTLGVENKDSLESLRLNNSDQTTQMLSRKIAGLAANLENDDYQDLIAKLTGGELDKEIAGLIDQFKDIKNISAIVPEATKVAGIDYDTTAINKALLGADEASNGLVQIISNFVDVKKVDLDAVKMKAVMCANFERRLKRGDLADLTVEQIVTARKLLYDGTRSVYANSGYAKNPVEFMKLAERLFDAEQYVNEKKVIKGINIDEILENLSTFARKDNEKMKLIPSTKQYLSCGSLAEHMKKFAIRMGNNKAWMRIFAPMTIALIAVTLLVQPLFGKIDKEFPEENKNGGAK